jgi:hypothetical protein
MKRRTLASFVTLLLLCLACAQAARAQSASGFYDFTIADDYVKHVEFDAQKLADGTSTGKIYFTDEEPVEYTDLDGTGDPSLVASYKGFFITSDVDSLVVTNNQAVMSGTVRDCTIPELIGQRVLLTVEDNGDNTRVLDQLTWGAYRFVKKDWTPSDAELKTDPGVGLKWVATDFERRDDKGVPQPPVDKPVDTDTYPVLSYSFVGIGKASGDITVKP